MAKTSTTKKSATKTAKTAAKKTGAKTAAVKQAEAEEGVLDNELIARLDDFIKESGTTAMAFCVRPTIIT